MDKLVEMAQFVKELFPGNPLVTCIVLLSAGLIYHSPTLLKILLDHSRESRKLTADIDRQQKLTSAEVSAKMAKINDRKTRTGQ